MNILQYQFTNIDENDEELIPEFNDFLIDRVFESINTKVNRRKISLRLNYLLDKVSWINWDNNKKYNTGVQDIIDAIQDSLVAVPYKNNLWKIQINSNITIPNSFTSIDRFVRFLNYGDTNNKATGIFSNLENKFNHQKLNNLWKYYYMQECGGLTDVLIISS